MNGMNEYRGSWEGKGLQIAIVASSFNTPITQGLIDGASSTLSKMGVAPEKVILVHVPGAFELPLVAKKLAEKGRFDAILCLGAVIRGETPHFDFVAKEAASGIAAASLDTGVPIIFGVLTVDTTEQALHRSGIKGGNKGEEAAKAAVEMATLLKKLKK